MNEKRQNGEVRSQERAWLNTLVRAMIVTVCVVAFITAILWPVCRMYLARGQMMASLSNFKELQLATQQMTVDGVATKDRSLGWPGDTGGSFSNWATSLVRGNYFTIKNLNKLLSVPGRSKVNNADSNVMPVSNDNGELVYAVKAKSSDDTVLLTSGNFINTSTGGAMDPAVKLWSNEGFIVMSKGGSGKILKTSQAGKRDEVGGYAPLCK